MLCVAPAGEIAAKCMELHNLCSIHTKRLPPHLPGCVSTCVMNVDARHSGSGASVAIRTAASSTTVGCRTRIVGWLVGLGWVGGGSVVFVRRSTFGAWFLREWECMGLLATNGGALRSPVRNVRWPYVCVRVRVCDFTSNRADCSNTTEPDIDSSLRS